MTGDGGLGNYLRGVSIVNDQALSSVFLDALQRETFDYFVHEANRLNGLIADKTQAGSPASIAAVGFALSSYPVGVERGFMRRADAIARTLTTLRFFHASVQSAHVDATGYKGFYYHFLDMASGRRVWKCELSTIDSAILLVGMLTAAAYFSGEDEDEREIRALADALYLRADWNWAQNDDVTVTHGWKPESGFLRYRWQGYCEAIILYLLGLGSPTHPLPRESWARWASTYDWRTIYDRELLYAGPLFIHQFQHVWIDFRGLQDDFMREKSADYFENSRRATYVHQQYAIANPARYDAYGENSWGITASDGPGPATYKIKGKKRRFFGYESRGAPDGPDDGSIAPWAVAASPFRARDRAAGADTFRGAEAAREQRLRLQSNFQRHRGRPIRTIASMDIAVPLRHGPGADSPDARELPHQTSSGISCVNAPMSSPVFAVRAFSGMARSRRGRIESATILSSPFGDGYSRSRGTRNCFHEHALVHVVAHWG